MKEEQIQFNRTRKISYFEDTLPNIPISNSGSTKNAKQQNDGSIQIKNITPQMLKMIRKYVHVASSQWETQLTDNFSLILKKRKIQQEDNLKDISNQVNTQHAPHYKSSSNTSRFTGGIY